jgi:lipopolysaccharide/colanic/teichoic acid biosynthesis glycosyltransferase
MGVSPHDERRMTISDGHTHHEVVTSVDADTLERADVGPLLTKTWARALKRALDLAGSLGLAVCIMVLVPLIALAIKIDSPGPVFFRQRRVGRDGQEFQMLKFRSMHIDAEQRLLADAELHAMFRENDFKVPGASDPRITRVGRILRACSLDELPQFWNVVMGSMSLVGPRPMEPRQASVVYAPGDICLRVKPGLTGLWQVSGRATIVGAERLALDHRYVETWSLGGDLVILVRTVPAVISARGAH